MYRDEVLLDDAVAVILLMECTAATSPLDYSLRKNPVDTEFVPFDKADLEFQKEKQKLLQRYRTDYKPNNGVSPPPFRSNDGWNNIGQRTVHQRPSFGGSQSGNDVDQYGRPLQTQTQLSQTQSTHPPRQNGVIRKGMTTEDQQWTPSSSHGSYTKSSDRRATVSQQSRHESFGHNPDPAYGNDNGSWNGLSPGNHNIHQHNIHTMSQDQRGHSSRGGGNPNGHNFEAPCEQERPRRSGGFLHPSGNGQNFEVPCEQDRPRSGGFLHPDEMSSQASAYTQESNMRQNQPLPISQQVRNFMESAPRSYDGHMPNQGGSGKRRRKRRAAD